MACDGISQRPGVPVQPSAGVLERLIGYNLKRAYMLFLADFREVLGDEGMSPRVFSVLTVVVEAPHVTQSEVARKLGIERSGLVAIVNELEKRGYVRRTQVPGDRRIFALYPTTEGARICAIVCEQLEQRERARLAILNPQERMQLMSILKHIRSELEGEG